jgi:hypothetical protein
LSDITHLLPEFHDPGDTSVEILPEDILRVLQKSDEEIEEIRQEALEGCRRPRSPAGAGSAP